MSTVRLPHHRYRDPLAAIEPKRLKRHRHRSRHHTQTIKAIVFLIACWVTVALIVYFS